MTDTKTLSQAIAAASLKVGGALETDKRNSAQGYDYLSADKILTIGGQALATHGVSLIPSIASCEVVTVERQGKGSRIDATVQFEMLIIKDAESQSVMWYGIGSDYASPDKALYKAITSGHKYFIMKLLNIGAGNEDGEHDEEGKQGKTETKQAEQKQATQQPAESKKQPQQEQAQPPLAIRPDQPFDASMLITWGYVDNRPHADKTANLLKLAAMTAEAAQKRVEIYKAWRAIGTEPQAAAENAIAGASVP